MKSEPFQRDSPSGEKQTCPRHVLGGVWPPKSDTSPSSAFLLIRTSGASPLPPYSPSYSTPSFLLLPPSFFPVLLTSLFSLFLSCYSILSHKTLFAFYPSVLSLFLPSLHFLPALSFSLLFHTFICELLEDSRGWGGWEGFSFLFFFELEQLLWVMVVHLPLRAPYTPIVGFSPWFIYTLTENYTCRTVWVASHVASLFCLKYNGTGKHIQLVLFKPLQETSMNSISAAHNNTLIQRKVILVAPMP